MRLNDLDLTIVVRNDQQYGAELKYLAAAGLPPDIARQTRPDVPALARSHGDDGVVIHDLSELRDEHLDRPGLFVIDARFTPTSTGGPLWMQQRSEVRFASGEGETTPTSSPVGLRNRSTTKH